MRKILIPFALGAMLHSATAQTISNNNFETWGNSLFNGDTLTGWRSNDSYVYYKGQKHTVSKSLDKFSGNYAVKLQNVKIPNFASSGGDSVMGAYAHTDVDIAGLPLPKYLTGHIKTNLKQGEKAWISFGYKVITSPSSYTIYMLGYKSFTGTSSGYIPFSIPTTGGYYPSRRSNLLNITLESYNTFRNSSGTPSVVSDSSYIIVDSIGFKDVFPEQPVVVNSTIANGNFTTWNQVNNVQIPSGWFLSTSLQDVTDGSIGQTTEAVDAPYALQLKIDPQGKPGYTYSLFKPQAGQKYVNFSSKFDLAKDDTVMVVLTKFSLANPTIDDEVIDSIIFTGNQSAYKGYSVSFNGKVSLDDTLAFHIVAYNPIQFDNYRLEATSTFLIDAVSVSAFPTGLLGEDRIANQAVIYPNPSVSGVFKVQGKEGLSFVQVTNNLGEQVPASVTHQGNDFTVDIAGQPKGVYSLSMKLGDKSFTSKLVY